MLTRGLLILHNDFSQDGLQRTLFVLYEISGMQLSFIASASGFWIKSVDLQGVLNGENHFSLAHS